MVCPDFIFLAVLSSTLSVDPVLFVQNRQCLRCQFSILPFVFSPFFVLALKDHLSFDSMHHFFFCDLTLCCCFELCHVCDPVCLLFYIFSFLFFSFLFLTCLAACLQVKLVLARAIRWSAMVPIKGLFLSVVMKCFEESLKRKTQTKHIKSSFLCWKSIMKR